MAAFHNFALRLAVIAMIAAKSIVMDAQAAPPTNRPASIVLNFRLDKDDVPAGQSPWAILIVDNLLTDRYFLLYETMYRVHVDGRDGEAPTTVRQRYWIGKFRAGDACLSVTVPEFPMTVPPGMSDYKKIELGYLYDLSVPGVYSVYAEVKDPPLQKWLRTKAIQFEIQAPTR